MAAALKDQALEAYRLHVLRHAAALAFLGAVVVLACMAALWSGSYATPLSELLRGIFGAAEDPAERRGGERLSGTNQLRISTPHIILLRNVS